MAKKKNKGKTLKVEAACTPTKKTHMWTVELQWTVTKEFRAGHKRRIGWMEIRDAMVRAQHWIECALRVLKFWDMCNSRKLNCQCTPSIYLFFFVFTTSWI
jgi:hypothetical protein